jgi:hypothetical protein
MKVEFYPSGRGKARCLPDPDYPNGIAIDVAGPDVKSCTVKLHYPAPECGYFEVRCEECSMSVAITAAGRPDDPVSVRMRCKSSTRPVGLEAKADASTYPQDKSTILDAAGQGRETNQRAKTVHRTYDYDYPD